MVILPAAYMPSVEYVARLLREECVIDLGENYVKRCVGTPGDSLQIIDNVIYINGEAEPVHPYLQLNYFVTTDGHVLGNSYLSKLGISK